MIIQKKRLAIAIAGAVSLAAFNAQAVDFTATADVQNTLTVTNVADMDLGQIFGSVTGGALTDGVGAVTFSPLGVASDVSTSTIQLISLVAGTPAQGSIDMAADFTLTFPDTSAVLEPEFDDGTGAALGQIVTQGTELSLADPTVAKLYLVHYTIGNEVGGTAVENATNDGDFTVTKDFGVNTYTFNIGATLVTEPVVGAPKTYEAGIYTGTFAVTASY